MNEDDLSELAEKIEYDGRLGVRDARALVAEVRRLRAALGLYADLSLPWREFEERNGASHLFWGNAELVAYARATLRGEPHDRALDGAREQGFPKTQEPPG